MPSLMPCLRRTVNLLRETNDVFLVLLKIMLPALIIVKLLQELGALEILGAMLGPVMAMVGLPAVLGVVWATTLLTNLFTGLIVFHEVTVGLSLSVAEVTVLGTMMLIGHSIPIEGAVARRAGVPWWVTIVLRVFGAMLLGMLLHLLYTHMQWLQTPAHYPWKPVVEDPSLSGWLIGQAQTLLLIYVVILSLILLLKLLRVLGFERAIHLALMPLLRLFGLGSSAVNVTVIGVFLGLAYGAGLLIRDLQRGELNRRDAFVTLCFLGLLHSLIEDTLVIMALGAHLSGILWARILFALLVTAVLARWMPPQEQTQEQTQEQMRSQTQTQTQS